MSSAEAKLRAVQADDLEERIEALGPWFHNINLNGVWTAPDHFLGDYPGAKFRRFASGLPEDLSGKSVLDIGCNAGFYSIEMKQRGAERVLGIDSDDRYLAQAQLASEALGFDDIEFAKLDVYDGGRFAFALRKESPQFRAQVDRQIECMKQDGTLKALYVKWFGEEPPADSSTAKIFPAAASLQAHSRCS